MPTRKPAIAGYRATWGRLLRARIAPAILQVASQLDLAARPQSTLEDKVPSMIDDLSGDFDAESDVDDHFSKVENFVSGLRNSIGYDDNLTRRVRNLESLIDEAKDDARDKKASEDVESYFTSIPTASPVRETKARSIFSDIDE